jgi:Mlc titration factor MtfA (ptsG expression regulator)
MTSWWKKLWSGKSTDKPNQVFQPTWKEFLLKHVSFYRSLEDSERERFEKSVLRFIQTTKITGIKTEVGDEERLLIGASAVIPIFSFPNWEYHNLEEVLLYPAHFDFNHNIGQRVTDSAILGLIGYGYMEGKMILSKKALHLGFSNETDKQNTAIHEFVHLIDKMDGAVDGIMVYLKDKSYLLPWLNLIDDKIEEILEGNTDIRPYGATNRAEFLAVASEYFFERPKMLKRNHPELYKYLEMMFNQPLADKKLVERAKPTRHFDPCPCGSGLKYRECCMKNA